MRRHSRLTALAIGTLAVTAAAAPPSASASAGTGSKVFSTRGEQAFVVPAGVTSVRVRLVGGSGGQGYEVFGHVGPGGRGAAAVATLAVTPGEVLFAEVAGGGANGSTAWPGAGGGGGGAIGGGIYAGGGGGASDVRTCSLDPARAASCSGLAALRSRLLVAGGGGGGGGNGDYWSYPNAAGGAAGAAGETGPLNGAGLEPGSGGQPGGQAAGGAAGGMSAPDAPAKPGALGSGGAGGGLPYDGAGGGGGGGGLYGGGGGGGGAHTAGGYGSGAGGAGGGGSSGVPSTAAGVSAFAASIAPVGAQPSATFSWTLPAPTVITAPSTGVSATTATIAGAVDPNGSQTTDCHFEINPAPPAGGRIACPVQVGSGSAPVAVSAPLSGLTPGLTYSFRLVAANTQGTTLGTTLQFATATPTATAVGRTPPHLTALRRAGRAFAFRLDRAATVRIDVRRLGAGKRARTLRVAARAGANRVRFGRRLTRGRYTATFVAVDASGSSSAPRRLRFRILAR